MSTKEADYECIKFLLQVCYDITKNEIGKRENYYTFDPISVDSITIQDLKKESYPLSGIIGEDAEVVRLEGEANKYRYKVNVSDSLSCALTFRKNQGDTDSMNTDSICDIGVMYAMSGSVAMENFVGTLFPIMLLDTTLEDIHECIPGFPVNGDPKDVYSCVVTEYSEDTHILQNFLNAKVNEKSSIITNDAFWKRLFLQVLVTLHKLAERIKGFKHNNLNTRTVQIVEQIPKNFKSKSRSYDLIIPKCDFVAKIIDFDVASSDHFVNPGKKAENPYHDMFYFFQSIKEWAEKKKFALPKQTDAFVKSVVQYGVVDGDGNVDWGEVLSRNLPSVWTQPFSVLNTNPYFEELRKSTSNDENDDQSTIEKKIDMNSNIGTMKQAKNDVSQSSDGFGVSDMNSDETRRFVQRIEDEKAGKAIESMTHSKTSGAVKYDSDDSGDSDESDSNQKNKQNTESSDSDFTTALPPENNSGGEKKYVTEKRSPSSHTDSSDTLNKNDSSDFNSDPDPEFDSDSDDDEKKIIPTKTQTKKRKKQSLATKPSQFTQFSFLAPSRAEREGDKDMYVRYSKQSREARSESESKNEKRSESESESRSEVSSESESESDSEIERRRKNRRKKRKEKRKEKREKRSKKRSASESSDSDDLFNSDKNIGTYNAANNNVDSFQNRIAKLNPNTVLPVPEEIQQAMGYDASKYNTDVENRMIPPVGTLQQQTYNPYPQAVGSMGDQNVSFDYQPKYNAGQIHDQGVQIQPDYMSQEPMQQQNYYSQEQIPHVPQLQNPNQFHHASRLSTPDQFQHLPQQPYQHQPYQHQHQPYQQQIHQYQPYQQQFAPQQFQQFGPQHFQQMGGGKRYILRKNGKPFFF